MNIPEPITQPMTMEVADQSPMVFCSCFIRGLKIQRVSDENDGFLFPLLLNSARVCRILIAPLSGPFGRFLHLPSLPCRDHHLHPGFSYVPSIYRLKKTLSLCQLTGAAQH